MHFKMKIKNYKSFKNWQEITFAPITILVGPNSGGKSSLLKLLGFLTQNLLFGSNNKIDSRIIYNGLYVNMGDFIKMTHNHNEKPIMIKFEVPRAKKADPVTNLDYEFYNEKSILSYIMEKNSVIPSFKFHNKNTFDNNDVNYLGNQSSEAEPHILDNGKFKLSHSTKKNIRAELIRLKAEFLNCLSMLTGDDIEKSEQRWHKFINNIIENHMLQTYRFNFKPNTYDYSILESPIFKYYNSNPQFFRNFKSIANDIAVDGKRLKTRIMTDRFIEADCFMNSNFREYCENEFKYLPVNTVNSLHENEDKKEIFSNKISLIENIKNVYNNHLSNKYKNNQLIVLENMLWHYLLEIHIKHFISEFREIRKYVDHIVEPTVNALFDRFVFLPSVRTAPKETYTEKELILALTGIASPVLRGELSDNSWQKTDVECILNNTNTVNDYLKLLGMNQIVDVRENQDTNFPNLYKLNMINSNTNLISSLQDVGYGYSQILPILYSLNNRYTGKRIVIEQPELHIHPAIQSKFAEIIIQFISNRSCAHKVVIEDGERIPLNYYDQNSAIIETHSEHIIRGLQIHVAKGNISPNDVSVNFIGKYKNGNSFIKRMHLTETGLFKDDWPGGLFEDSYQQSLELLKHQ